MMRWFALLMLVCGAVTAPTVGWAAARPDPGKLTDIRVQDLHYGDVLFHFYAGDDFGALTRLEAYNHWHLMPHHQTDAALLAGGLYLSLGMHNEAGRRFQALLNADVPVGVRNRAWFYLARTWYERGYYQRAQDAIARIQGQLPPEFEEQRENLLVNALMRQQRFDAAVAVLRQWHGAPDWMLFARFNLGVALARQNKLAEADPFLTAVGTAKVTNEELMALKDRANLALGFAYLQAGQPAIAKQALDRVRLDGPYSSRALLGAGWASAALGQYREALVPWLELHRRNLLDAAVQESYLAVPYAYGKLNAGAQAAQYYQSALDAFGTESGQLDAAITHIRTGHMLDELLSNAHAGNAGQGAGSAGLPSSADQAQLDTADQSGWLWQLKALPDAPQSRYLYSLMADNDFQDGLKNYRDLNFMQGTLTRWSQSMDAFGDMIDARKLAYAQRLPRTDALLASDAPAKLRDARAAIDSRLESIETTDNVAALGTPAEQAQWARIAALEADLGALPAGADRDAAREKLRLIKGVLYWKLDQAFQSRSYQEHRALHELDRALNEAQNRWVRVQRARATVPTDTGEFAARIAALAGRITALRTQLDVARQQENDYLQGLAITTLQAQQQRLDTYRVQARFALADIYDRAADGDKAAAPAAPAPALAPASAAAPVSAPAPAPAGPATSSERQ